MNSCYYSYVFFFTLLTILYAEELGKPGCLEKEDALSLLETADDLLSKANDAYPTCRNQSECGGKLPLSYIELSKKLISDVRENFPTCPEVIVPYVKHKDCSEILASGSKKSGVYAIWLSESCTTGRQLQVYCDMQTDYGGWTLIQRRGKFPVQQDFFQDWDTYKNGFGNISQEFWLGNENIRVLCHEGCEIRFDLQAQNGTKGFAVYKNFNLTKSSYTLYVNHYTGNVGDGMEIHNNNPFSTKDKGRIESAKQRQGAWWYSGSTQSNLNGIYQPGKSGWEGVVWNPWLQTENLASVEIKVRPK